MSRGGGQNKPGLGFETLIRSEAEYAPVTASVVVIPVGATEKEPGLQKRAIKSNSHFPQIVCCDYKNNKFINKLFILYSATLIIPPTQN